MLKQLSLTLLLASTAVQAQRVTTLDWSFGAGPSTATPSGRRSRVASNDPCFSCKKTDQLVTGADEGKFNAALRATGQPSNWGIAFQMEGLFNHAVSLPAAAPAPTCTRYSCEQRRQALVDDAWLLGAGVEFAPFDAKRISPYVVVTGGLSLNRLTWSQDSTNTRDESGRSVQVGPYVSAGAGIRVQIKRWISAFAEGRYYATLVTSGSMMTPLAIGVVLRTRFADDTEY